MHFRHVVSYKPRKITSSNISKSFRIIIGNKFTDNNKAIVSNALRTIHYHNELTSLLDDKSIILLIIILRETEDNIRNISTITFYRKNRNSLNTINFKFPLVNKLVKTLPAILSYLLGGIDIHQSLSEMGDRILIIKSSDKTDSRGFLQICSILIV